MKTILFFMPVVSLLVCVFSFLKNGPRVENEGYWFAVIIPWALSLIIGAILFYDWSKM